MPDADRDRFQTAVSEQMATFSRAPFSGPVALKIDLATTGQNAPQAHTIVKNLLDLLGKRRAGVPGKHRHLLYKDDSQIEALSVSCRHGEDYPMIHVAGRPLSALLGDMEFAAEAIRADDGEL
jgi:Holliday junction resolvase RusA-like endonuclease